VSPSSICNCILHEWKLIITRWGFHSSAGEECGEKTLNQLLTVLEAKSAGKDDGQDRNLTEYNTEKRVEASLNDTDREYLFSARLLHHRPIVANSF